jgi:hypothetical protein
MLRAETLLLIAAAACACAACADTSSDPGDTGPTTEMHAPYQVELRCGADGSTRLSSDTVQPQPDGVHLVVLNEYEEPVSVEGFDAEPGRTTWVLARGPGDIGLMCWPFSLHGSGEEPARIRLTIVDPQGLYVDGTVPCEPTGITVGEWVEEPIDPGPPPLDVARGLIEGLRSDDELLYGGYPDQPRRSVVVVRDGQVVASYSIVRFAGEPWSIMGGTACADTGLPFAGEQVG